jgi:hypothetical protein
MPLPLLLVIPALIALAGTGTAIGVDGAIKMKDADDRRKKALRRQERAQEKLQDATKATRRQVKAYGQYQGRVAEETLGAYIAWLQFNQHRVSQMEGAVADGVEVATGNIPDLEMELAEAGSLLTGGIAAVATGIAARQAALFGVQAAATAGTGAAISGLSGVAAESATLAWLGGGTLAAGGGGMAAGAVVLTGVAVAPALLLGGITLGIQGEKAQTRADEIEADVAVSVEHMRSARAALGQIGKRVHELRSVLKEMDARATEALAELTALEFDPALHIAQFMRTAQLMRAVREILSTPVLDRQGNLTDESYEIIVRYRQS